MLVEAAGFALLASLSPTALLVAAVYLGSARPKLIAAVYLVGAVAMSLITGLLLVEVLRNAGLSRPGDHGPRYGVRLGLGVLLLIAGVVVARRHRPPPELGEAREGLVSKLVANPSPRSAFLVGIVVFAPGVTFLAAVQVIATAQAGLDLTLFAVVMVVAINVLLVWLPILLYLAAPQWTARHLTAFNGWLRAHTRTIVIWVLLVGGAILIGNGIYGLVVF